MLKTGVQRAGSQSIKKQALKEGARFYNWCCHWR